MYAGESPLALQPAPKAANPVLTAADVTDMKVDTLAHPFLVIKDKRYYVFFTAKDLRSDKGGIGLAESGDGTTWKFRRTVIREPFVQSHPYVFAWQNEYYLVRKPTRRRRSGCTKRRRFRMSGSTWATSWRATALSSARPWRTTRACGGCLRRPPGTDAAAILASHFEGPWKEHPLSPIVKKDLRTARPAGRPFVIDGVLYRLGQDCYPTYGRAVLAFQITDISPTSYTEKMVETPVVQASGEGWNSTAMHHVDAQQTATGQWIAVVDALGLP